jgi:hypothetical protein
MTVKPCPKKIMKKTLACVLSAGIFAGCASMLPKEWLGESSLTGLHYASNGAAGGYDVVFDYGFSGGPISDYRLKKVARSGHKEYRLYVYASLGRAQPRSGIRCDRFPGKLRMRISLALPDFDEEKDSLVLVDRAGEHPIRRQAEPAH